MNTSHLSLRRLAYHDENTCQFFESVYLESFPEQERREIDELWQIAKREQTPFTIELIYKEEEAIGFISYWDFQNFIYVEHFALAPQARGAGAGSFAIADLKERLGKPIVLEVEPPTGEIEKRRISFYERMGFQLWPDFHYMQPPYRLGDEHFELKLMTAGELDLLEEGKNVVAKIHREVYNFILP